MRVLYVDDDPMWLGLVKEMLREAIGGEAQIATALTGMQALDIVKRFPLDLAIFDIGLLDMSGYELIRKSKQAKPALPVAALTGSRDLSVGAKAKSEGAFHCLGKPVTLEGLQGLLEQARESVVPSAN